MTATRIIRSARSHRKNKVDHKVLIEKLEQEAYAERREARKRLHAAVVEARTRRQEYKVADGKWHSLYRLMKLVDGAETEEIAASIEVDNETCARVSLVLMRLSKQAPQGANACSNG